MPVTVLIVDDHPGFRTHARHLLESRGYAVVGEAADGEAGITEARRLRPALVLLDIQLPDADGFAVAQKLASFAEPPAVVLISTRDSPSLRRRAAAAPVRSFVPKDALLGAALPELLGR